jgi:HJR/Mrr/RecB family endonuclease
MGFLKSFFAAMAANEISEKKRQEAESKKAVLDSCRNVDKILAAEGLFLDYLKQLNCRNVEYADLISDAQIEYGTTTNYDVLRAQQTIDRYKQQLRELMKFGGDPQYVKNLDKLDLYIDIVKRLKEYGWLDKQQQYVEYADDTYWLDRDWENAQKDRHKLEVQIPAILNAQGNELKEIIKSTDYRFIPFESHQNAIVVDTASSNDETVDNFLEFLTIAAVFTDEYIIIYNYERNEMYYQANIKWKNVDADWTEISGWNWSLVEINGLSLLFNTEKAKEVVLFYGSHNVRVAEAFRDQYNAAYENINSLSGVEFEQVCKRLLENMGFSVETTKTTGDGGIDLIAYNSQPLLSGKYIIQCKRYTGSVGEPIIRDLYGVITSERANKGILMTSGVFTKQAQAFAEDKPIELIDGVKLKELLENYYN